MANEAADGGTEFDYSLDYACRMAQMHQNSGNNLVIIYVTDGKDSLDPSNYISRMKSMNIKFYYIRVDSNQSRDMSELASQTGGKTVDATNLNNLKEDMKSIVQTQVFETITVMETVEVTEIVEVTETEMITESVYCDALRDINKSTTAMIVTGVLLLVVGLLIGFTLTIMFSLQGQKRFQMVLSPLMAILAFLLLVFGDQLIPEVDRRWILEGMAFTLLGIVLMRSNAGHLKLPSAARMTPVQPDRIQPVSEPDEW